MIGSEVHAVATGGGTTAQYHSWPKSSDGTETAGDESFRSAAYNSLYRSSPYSCIHEIDNRPAFVAYAPSTEDVLTNALRSISQLAEARSVSEASAASSAVRAALLVAYSLERKSLSRAAAKGLMRFVESNAKVNCLAATNGLLVELDTNRLSSRAITGVVRATARMQKLLPAWDKTYARAWVAISAQGKSPQAMFVGMDKPAESDIVAGTK